MKPAEMSSGIPFLSIDIISNVLQQLPVKSLLRFQTVCKLWKNIIKSPSFIASHLEHSIRENPSLIIVRHFYRNNSFHLYCLDRDMKLSRVPKDPLIDSFKSAWIFRSYNGVLCVQVDLLPGTLPSLYLWNPATREVMQVPRIRTIMNSCWICSLGFAASPTVNDLKIVLVISISTRGDVSNVVEVYSLSTNSWKKIHMASLKDMDFRPHCITSKGAIFWFATMGGLTSHGGDHTNVIVSFDLEMDEFRLVTPPPSSRNKIANLTLYENRLAVFHYSNPSNTGNTPEELWVVEEGIGGSWSKVLTFGPYPYYVLPLTIWRNKIFFNVFPEYSVEGNNEIDDAGSFLFDLTSNEVKVCSSSRYGIYSVQRYVESLVLLRNFHKGKQ
ncbi:unnamed protein product [Cuscuta epithymum]|uniref:F-box domain-containing protein n=1 Tax=Cuscuta epithymum TaxID=186058 RepID=A0AAV0FQJ2_9ASTE|nr:unnamed protein product [Cuscuta epithymum]